MTSAQRVLSNIFKNQEPHYQGVDSAQLSEMYADVAFLETALDYLKEELWLKRKAGISCSELADHLFSTDLSQLSYLLEALNLKSAAEIKEKKHQALEIQGQILGEIQQRNFTEQKKFLKSALTRMSFLFHLESQLQNQKKSQGTHLGFSFYRTFDGLDKIFNLDYSADRGMKQDLDNKERLYEGAGVGVQSGYSTVLTALRYLNLQSGDRFIDLGSGYGRVGLVVGLIHPEVDFTGYEFVPHRVDIANASTEKLEMKSHVHFYTQDLSLKDFKIPEAEVYYLYDPFSEETYGHVLGQLIALGRVRKVMIVTKGNARKWLMQIVQQEGWREPEQFDDGNLCLFASI